ncbi:MAG: alpha/beta hydrolase [Hyphomicrobiaceae bacterium]
MPNDAQSQSASAPTYEIETADVTYRTDGGRPLLAHVFRPMGDGPFPIMIDLHGGAWVNGDRMNDKVLCEAMARAGIVAVAIDFRMPPDAAYPGSLADINYAVRWARTQAAAWNGRADRIGLVGISSGGHQAMLAAMRPDDPRYGAISTADVPAAAADVQCVVLCWPVIDPLGRYRYAREAVASGRLEEFPRQLPDVIPSHEAYWGTEDTMGEASPPRMLERGEKVALPPVLYVQGDADKMHPRPQLDTFVQRYRAAGGTVDLALYPGEVEGFVTRQPKSEANKLAATERIVAFIRKTLG